MTGTFSLYYGRQLNVTSFVIAQVSTAPLM